MIPNSKYWGEVQDLIESFEIEPGGKKYLLRGRLYVASSYSDDFAYTMQPLSNKDNIVSQIKNTLYQLVHCRVISTQHQIPLSSEYDITEDFIETLSAANSGKGTWEAGWQIRKIEMEGKQLGVHKDGLTIFVKPTQFTLQDNLIEVGKMVKVMMTKEYRAMLPGFYMAVGDAEVNSEDKNSPLVRIYWNIMASAASQLVKYLSTKLNVLQIPFRFKVVNNPHHFTRADAGVLYIKKCYLERSKAALSEIYKQIKCSLNYSTPLFAKRLSPGLSLAEDPNNNQSFGEHRCSIFAQALCDAHKKADVSSLKKLEYIEAYFKTLDIDLGRPYLNSSSIDDYDILLEGAFDNGG